MTTWDRHSESDRDRLQRTLLHDWIEDAATFAPYWREHLRGSGIDPGDVDDLDDLADIPAVRELDLLVAGGPGSPALVQRPTEAQIKAQANVGTLVGIARSIRRGGSSGKDRAVLTEYKPIHLHAAGRDGRLSVAYTRSDLDRLHRAGARAASVLGLTRRDYLVSAVPPGPQLRFWGVYHLALGASILAVHPRGAGAPVDTVARGFELVPATVVAVPVDEALDLAATLTEAGVDLARIRTVVTVGAPPTPDQRARIVDAWRAAGAEREVRVLTLWAPSAARTLWAECAASAGAGDTGLHTYPDLEVLEVLDPAFGRPVGTGAGDLTYTSVGWSGTALIRYRTGDAVGGLDRSACPRCGRTTPRVLPDIIPGAWQPLVATPDGRRRIDLRGAAAVLAADRRIATWRLELPPARRKQAYVVHVAAELDDAARGELSDRLRSAVGYRPDHLELADRDAIEATVAEVGSRFADAR